jgi:Tfp pilus assembly protein PilE
MQYRVIRRCLTGLTLTELAVVIAVMALLAGLALPAARMIIGSFESGDGARSMISAALASARALAAKEGHYVGVRFQKAYNPEAPDPLNPLTAPQYMIFVIHDSNIMAHCFRAIEGTKPIRLPDSVIVTDLTIVPTRNVVNPVNPALEIRLDDPALAPAAADDLMNQAQELRDATTFSIVFSPSGKLVLQGVRVRRQGIGDAVFNESAQVDAGVAMFYQDDYFGPGSDLGLGPEPSRNRFIILDRDKFARAYKAGKVWSDYLAALATETIYLNPYTGTIISKD